jgi:hypothetical protein
MNKEAEGEEKCSNSSVIFLVSDSNGPILLRTLSVALAITAATTSQGHIQRQITGQLTTNKLKPVALLSVSDRTDDKQRRLFFFSFFSDCLFSILLPSSDHTLLLSSTNLKTMVIPQLCYLILKGQLIIPLIIPHSNVMFHLSET